MKINSIILSAFLLGAAQAVKMRGNCDSVTIRTCADSQCSDECQTLTYVDKLSGLCQTTTTGSASYSCSPKAISEASFTSGDCSGAGADFTLLWGVCTATTDGKYQISFMQWTYKTDKWVVKTILFKYYFTNKEKWKEIGLFFSNRIEAFIVSQQKSHSIFIHPETAN